MPPQSAQPQSTSAQPPVQMQQGRAFAYAMPAGWAAQEDGPSAVVLVAPDRSALTIMVGNCGMLKNTNPIQYAVGRLSALRVADLRVGQPMQVQPRPGFAGAWTFEYTYSSNGIPCHGLATCQIQYGYDTCNIVLTAAASVEAMWPNYSTWLPGVAASYYPLNGAAFGAAAVQHQNIDNSTAFGRQAQAAREQSARTWDEVARQREQSQARNNDDFRQTIGGTTRYYDPYASRAVDLSSSNVSYWVNTYTGQIVGSDNSSFDPRTATNPNWQRMAPTR